MGSPVESGGTYYRWTLNELVAKAREVREESGQPSLIIRDNKEGPGQFCGYDDHALADWLETQGDEKAELATALRQKFAERLGELRENKGKLDTRAEELSRDLTEVVALRRRIEPVL